MKVQEILKGCAQWFPPEDSGRSTPKVTVVLPTFRRKKGGYLKRAIESVLNQSFYRLELIVVDDCSVDGSYDLIREYMKKDARVGCIRHSYNVGLPAISQYEGFQKARGTYIAYIFDDNQWYPTALAETYDMMVKEGAKASFGITNVMDPKTRQMVRIGDPETTDISLLPIANLFGNGAVVLHRDVLEDVGLYDPHLSLTRICDWDLWKRISNKYRFLATGVLYTRGLGTVLDDSLGNSFKLDPWFAEEHIQHRDELQLLPENYEEIDISVDNWPHSRYYHDCMEIYLAQYQTKKWYKGSDTDKLTIDDRCRRVLVASSGVPDASYMNFMRCAEPFITIMFRVGTGYIADVSLADIFVAARNLELFLGEKDLFAKLNIPVYYFTDDNFIVIAKEQSGEGLLSVARCLTKENMASLQGVIVTTPTLQDYFRRTGLHQNVIVLDAIIRDGNYRHAVPNDNTTTIAFMGGAFRGGVLRSCVLPALKKISEDHPIRLALPDDGLKGLDEYESRQFEIVKVTRTSNYELALSEYAALKPQILVHCGNTLGNNRYKTKNALLNAVSTGAVLVASDIEPYCYREDEEPDDYILAENSIQGWYRAVLDLIECPSKRLELFNAARDYCLIRYDAHRVWLTLRSEFEGCGTNHYVRYIKNGNHVLAHILARGLGHTNTQPATHRKYIPEELSTSGSLRRKRTYCVTCTRDHIEQIGILFAVFGNCSGLCRVTIKQRGTILGESTVSMGSIHKNAYTFLPLPCPIDQRYLDTLDVTIELHYDERNAGSIEVFEERQRRSFFYKVFNKLGMPIKGKDTLFVDFS